MYKDSKFNEFLSEKGIKIYSRDRFVKRESRKNPVTSIDYSLFLDKEQKVKSFLLPLVRETIHRLELKIYFVMLSWWGRGDQALWTGSDLLKTLLNLRRDGMCEILLSYQAGDYGYTRLCEWCQKRRIEILDVDKYQLLTTKGKEVVVEKKSPGKAENMMKALKLINKRVEKNSFNPQKVLVIFIDDDYTQYHWINYFLLFAPWVFSLTKKTGDKQLDQLLSRIKRRVCFIKSGSPRIILPYEIQEQIVHGGLKVMDYLDVTLAIIDLALAHQRFSLIGDKKIDQLISALKKIRAKKQVYAPQNRDYFLGDSNKQLLEKIWREYVYRGGRVTQRLEGIFRRLSHKNQYRWLSQFTYLLHGDQGAPLDAWLRFSPFGGYAIEVSLLFQAIWDRAFQDSQILNVISLPHSHQRSKELDIWNMLDSILLALDLSRVLYGDLSVNNFLSVYKFQQPYPVVDRFGGFINYQPQYKELTIYPPLKDLRLE